MKYTDTYLTDLRQAQLSIPEAEKLKNATILITGVGGLIGSSIADFLMELNDSTGANIRLLFAARNEGKLSARFGNRLLREDVSFVPYDALKPVEWEEQPDYIIHAASPAFPAAYASAPVETMLANIFGLQNILNYAREKNVRRVLYVSSSEVYGKKESAEPYGENEFGYVDILNPRACYPSAKRASETLCAAYRSEYGVDSVIVRPGHIYGPTASAEDNRAATAFLRDAKAGRDIVMKSPGTQLRSYCYSIDCATAILTVLIHGECGKAYNISNTDSVITIRQLAEIIASQAGQRLIFDLPTDEEKKSYNLMDNSSLTGESLERLGWKGIFDARTGVAHALDAL